MNITKLQIAVSSPAFWAIVGLFAYNIIAYFQPSLTGNVQVGANVILSILAMYLHPAEVQTAGLQK
jgi:hypothetical protein